MTESLRVPRVPRADITEYSRIARVPKAEMTESSRVPRRWVKRKENEFFFVYFVIALEFFLQKAVRVPVPVIGTQVIALRIGVILKYIPSPQGTKS